MTGPDAQDPTIVRLCLDIAGERLEADVRLPTRAVRPIDLLPVLMSLDDAVLAIIERYVARQGKTVSCTKGCGACCRQLVPITEVDALYLREIVSEMPDERRAHVESRFRAALEELRRSGMLDRLRGVNELDFEGRQRLSADYFACGVACPLLEEESCSIHRDRPLTCREYLVTSPAEECGRPMPQRTARIALPVKLSQALGRFGDGVGRREPRWLPLVLALDWSAAPQPRVPGTQMFENFLRLVRELAAK